MPNSERILLVEDDKDAMAAVFFALTQAGYSVLTADDGAQAVDLLSHGIHPKLIVLDLVLPKVDGREVVKHLQGDKDLRSIPIIVTTAVPDSQPRIQGVDVILTKPVDPSRLVLEIARLLGGAVAQPIQR